jgi:hypothetical protein
MQYKAELACRGMHLDRQTRYVENTLAVDHPRTDACQHRATAVDTGDGRATARDGEDIFDANHVGLTSHARIVRAAGHRAGRQIGRRAFLQQFLVTT